MMDSDFPSVDTLSEHSGPQTRSAAKGHPVDVTKPKDASPVDVSVDDSDVQTIGISGEDGDLHTCGKCRLDFNSIDEYIRHKLSKEHNCKLNYRRSTLDKDLILPELVSNANVKEKPTTVSPNKDTSEPIGDDAEVSISKYICCGKTFKREAALKQHQTLIHGGQEDAGGDVFVHIEIQNDGTSTNTLPEQQVYDPYETGQFHTLKILNVDGSRMYVMPDGGMVVEANTIRPKGPPTQFEYGRTTSSLSGSPPGSPEQDETRKHECSICNLKFKTSSVLKTHSKTHSDERNYVCPFPDCDYTFKVKGSLKRHERRHTGERPYKCQICQRSFGESGALTRHLKSRVSCAAKDDLQLPRYGKQLPLNNRGSTEQPIMDCQQKYIPAEDTDHVQEITESNLASQDTSQPMTEEQSGQLDTVIEEDNTMNLVEETVSIVTTEVAANQDVAQEDFDILKNLEEVLSDLHCKACKMPLEGADELHGHLRSHLAMTPFHCTVCPTAHMTARLLSKHTKEAHNVDIPELDEGNNIEFYQTTSLTDQKTPEHKEVMRVANIAMEQLVQNGVDTRTPGDVMCGGGPDSIFICPICLKTFKGPNYLKMHIRVHAGYKPFECGQCSKAFSTMDFLNKHMYSHSDVRTYKCGECGKLFKRITHVKEHLKSHSDERPFGCSVCDKTFKTHNACKVHIRTHSSQHAHGCVYCKKVFREKASLDRHIRTHTGEKPFPCPRCGRHFAEHGSLNRHIKAKAPCTSQSQTRDTVLAEFSNVVADTNYLSSENKAGGTGEGASDETIQLIQVANDTSDNKQAYLLMYPNRLDG